MTETPLPAHGSPDEYEFVDASVAHGWPYSYLIKGVGYAEQERAGPVRNPCSRPHPANCEFDFAANQEPCPLVCPAGDVSHQGEAPISLEIVLRDSCGFAIEGYETQDVRVYVHSDEPGNFELCCAQQQPTIVGRHVVLPTGPTDSEGRTYVDIWWGGGSDTLLQMTAYLADGRQLEDELTSQVRSPDIDGDCQVGLADMSIFSQYFGTSAWQADFNCDGIVGLADYSIISQHYGHECGSTRTLPIPPELVARLGETIETGAGETELSLGPNTPNPFNPATEIAYTVPMPGSEVKVAVYDLSGRRVRTLVGGQVPPGRHVAVWDGTDEGGQRVASGVYFYRLEMPGIFEQKKMILLK